MRESSRDVTLTEPYQDPVTFFVIAETIKYLLCAGGEKKVASMADASRRFSHMHRFD